MKNEISEYDLAANTEVLWKSPKSSQRDSDTLRRMGKKQVLNRRFAFLSMLSFSCTVLATWEAVLSLFSLGFVNGGPVGLIGQFILSWGGTLCTFITIGELASMAPTSGGQYHWVSMMAPRSIRTFASYMIGWLTVLAWVAVIATGSFLCAAQIQALSIVSWPDYVPEGWHGTLITWAVILVSVFFNTIIGSVLPKVEGAFLILHIVGFFAILIPLVHFSPKRSASELFSRDLGYLQEGGYTSYGVTFLVGITGSASAFAGADAAVHMSEEIRNPAKNVPRSIVASILLNGALGFGMLIAVLFCLGDVDKVLAAEEEYGIAYIEIFLNGTRSLGGTTAMATIMITIGFSNAIGFIATGSRMIWSFARDNGLPFSAAFRKVSPHSKIPILAVITASVLPCLLVIINVGSTTVFNDVTSLALAALYASYFTTCALLLYHRLTPGSILDPAKDKTISYTPAYKDPQSDEYVLTWGPWHIRGIPGIVINVIALCYLLVVWIFSFFPSKLPATAENMNYSSVVFGGTILFSLAYWFVKGRKTYSGPVVEIPY